MKNNHKILISIFVIAFIIWLLSMNGCFESQNNRTGGGHNPHPLEIVPDPNLPCLNNPLVNMNLAAPSPVSGKPGALFGCRRYANTNCNLSVGDKPKRHRGIDLLATEGTDVYAMYDGIIHMTRKNVGCDNQKAHGNRILIKSTVDGIEYIFYYCHLSSIHVNNGDSVQRGQKIGKSGKTGNACYVDNAHLHVEIKRGDTYYEPQEFMTTRFDNNGNVSKTCR